MLAFRRSLKSPWVLAWLLCFLIALYSLWMCDQNSTLQERSVSAQYIEGPNRNKDLAQDVNNVQEVPQKSAVVELLANEKPSDLQVKEEQPFPTRIQRVVYYLWCGLNPNFMFANYLSLLSVAKFLQPHSILFLYTTPPGVDKHFYNTWLDEFKTAHPCFDMKEVKSLNCSGIGDWLPFIRDYLRDGGGIFMGTNTILTKPSLHMWNVTSSFLPKPRDPRTGIIVAKDGRDRNTNVPATDIQCTELSDVHDPLTSLCMHVYLKIKPKDFWHVESDAGKLLNFLMYGRESTPVAQPHPHAVIPNVAHVLWLNGRKINFVFYLSALSLLYVVKVDTLYIHGNQEPKREGYWEKLMEEPRVRYINIIKPNKMFDQETESPHHTSDVFRAQIMERYGGIYSDVDAIWTQPLSEELRSYDAVAALDFAHSYLYYPDYINLGVTMGRKGAPFWKHFTDSFRVIKDDVFGFNGLLQPYKIYERHPDTLRIHSNLQVMCFRDKCYPAWTKDWKSVNWKEETYAFHWTYPDPPEFRNETTLMRNNSMFADIGRFVLEKAGKL